MRKTNIILNILESYRADDDDDNDDDDDEDDEDDDDDDDDDGDGNDDDENLCIAQHGNFWKFLETFKIFKKKSTNFHKFPKKINEILIKF